MYAIIKTGGKQYRVSVGDKLKVETLAVEAGAQVTLTEVLAVSGEEGLKVGNPTIEGATVTATVLSHGRGEKVRIFKFRRRKHSMKSAGHRQNAGNNVGMGKDHTLYALVDGVVKFEVKGAFNRQYVKVEPIAA